jgi:hypothetical protein
MVDTHLSSLYIPQRREAAFRSQPPLQIPQYTIPYPKVEFVLCCLVSALKLAANNISSPGKGSSCSRQIPADQDIQPILSVSPPRPSFQVFHCAFAINSSTSYGPLSQIRDLLRGLVGRERRLRESQSWIRLLDAGHGIGLGDTAFMSLHPHSR